MRSEFRESCEEVARCILLILGGEHPSKVLVRELITALSEKINFLNPNKKNESLVKREGCLYWSKSALELRDYYNEDILLDKSRHKKTSRTIKKHKDGFLVEHPVPKAYIVSYFYENQDKSAEHLSDFLYKHLRTVLLRKSENKLIPTELNSTMPEGWKPGDDLFARYEGLSFRHEIVENPLGLNER